MPPEIRFGPAEEYDPRYEQFQYDRALQDRRFNQQSNLTLAQELMRERLLDRRENRNQQFLDQREQFRHGEAEDQRQFVADQNQVKQQGAVERIHDRYDAAGQAKIKQYNDARQQIAQEAGQLLQRDPQMRNPATRQRLNYYSRFSDMLDQKQAGVPTVPPPEPPDPQDLENDINGNVSHMDFDENGQMKMVPGPLPAGKSGTIYVRTVRNGHVQVTPHEIKADANTEEQKAQAEMARENARAAQAMEQQNFSAYHNYLSDESAHEKEDISVAQKGHQAQDKAWQAHYDGVYQDLVDKEKAKDLDKQQDASKLQAQAQKETERWYGSKPIYQAPASKPRLSYPAWKQQFIGGQQAPPDASQQAAPGPQYYDAAANAIVRPASPYSSVGGPPQQQAPVPAASGNPTNPMADPFSNNAPPDMSSAPKAGLPTVGSPAEYGNVPHQSVYVDRRDGKKYWKP